MSIVITGNPGVGKHTVARKLSSELGFAVVDLNQVAITKGIYEKKGTTLDVDVSRLAKVVKKMLKSNTIVVGHLAPYVVPKRQVKFALVLRKNPYKLITVYKKRKYSKKKAFENLGSEILGVVAYDAISRFGSSKVYQLDATGLSAKKIINKIRSIFKKKFASDRVDWLSMVAKNNDLTKFFPPIEMK
jgi:adenylate kinase